MTEAVLTAPLDREEPAKDTRELAQRWKAELKAADKELRPWHDQAEKIVKRYIDDREDGKRGDIQKLNLFAANTNTLKALLFGKTPKVGVERRWGDSQDDVARVAGEIMERLLNADVEGEEEQVLHNALLDYLVPGMSGCRVRYDMGEPVPGEETPAQLGPDGAELAPAVPAREMRPDEKAVLDYVYWKDQLWSQCRTFADLRWWAFGADMSRDQLVERFGKKGKDLPIAPEQKATDSPNNELKAKDHLARARVWEIWSKDDRTVYWVAEGSADLLDSKDDPLELVNFWPFPRPMFANLTTSKLIPTPDFVLAQDLYDEIDEMSTRALRLEKAIKVRFAYDKNNEELKRLVSQTDSEEGIAVDGWAAFAEKNGLDGAISWMPIDKIVQALQILNEQIDRKIAQLYQISGMSDIMRGQATEAATATEQAIKARFASVRVQTLQDEFARYASDAQRLKAEIISKHFQQETINERSNIMRTADAKFAHPAVQLLQSKFSEYRIVVEPDSVSLTDFAALKQERFEFAQTISGYFQSMIPFVQMLAGAGPTAAQASIKFTLGMAQSMVAGLKGSSEMEGIFDEFVAELEQAAQQPPPPPPPDPKLEAAKVKAGAEQVKAKTEIVKTGLDLQVAQQEHAMDMQQMQAEQQHAGVMAGIKGQEAQQRIAALKEVGKVTGGDDK